MCIIIYCDKKHRIDHDTLLTCWDNNPDGGGYMWADGERVHISKGYMTFEDYENALNDVPAGVPLVLHMRIGTSGGHGPDVTHPFPVTSKLEYLHALDCTCPIGIAHNGVLPYPHDDKKHISDTVYYVQHVIAPLSNRSRRGGGLIKSRRAVYEMRETSRGSRLCLLDASGTVKMIGDGWQGVAPGIQASNGSFRKPKFNVYSFDCFDYCSDDFYTIETIEYDVDACDCLNCIDCRRCKHVGPACFPASAEMFSQVIRDKINNLYAFDEVREYAVS